MVSTHCMALGSYYLVFHIRLLLHNFKSQNVMNTSEFLFRYQTNGAPREVSINVFYIQERVEYRNSNRWYCDNKKHMCESEIEEIHVSPLAVTSASQNVLPALSSLFSSGEMNVVRFI